MIGICRGGIVIQKWRAAVFTQHAPANKKPSSYKGANSLTADKTTDYAGA